MEALRCEGLTSRARRRAPRRPVIQGLDLRVGEGEVVGLLGHGGAGKTTLLSLLAGLARPAAGAAWVLGERVPCRRRQAELGALIGRPGVHPWLTGRAHLEVLARCGPPCPPGTVDRALRLTGLGRLADRRVGTWAAPARHRLALAAALLRRPRLLLLDEPVAGLDAEGGARVAALLAALAREGVSMLLAARRLGTLEPLCARVVVLDGGRLVTDRPPAAVRVRIDPGDHAAAERLLAGYGPRAEAPGVLLAAGGDGFQVHAALVGGGVYPDSVEPAPAPAGDRDAPAPR